MMAWDYAQNGEAGNRVGLHYSPFGPFPAQAFPAHQRLARGKKFSRRSNPLSRVSGADLMSADLSSAYPNGTDLSRKNLGGASRTGANL